ncbi:hypothetical protein C8Q77DRAFT_1058376 [Trametes polyzona]|nr:hypothetical protein C8Q77DRAFT_1058376 [Trametes polyzona]
MDDRTIHFSYDLLILVLRWLQDDYNSLFHSALVDHSFREAAATYLYRKVTFSPAFTPVLDLKRRDPLQEGLFVSAQMPHNAPLVRRLEVSGFVSTRPAPLNKLPGYLMGALECWVNLHTVVFAPRQYHEDLFTDILPLLPRLQRLRSISVNPSCADEKHAAALVQLRRLESLTIHSPTRAILQFLPDWLKELEPTLREFRLTHGCGSVTPGVLRSFLPHLQNVPTFAIGLSYSLTDDDVFKFWQDMPRLESLEARYYRQLRPPIRPRLTHLRSLTARFWSLHSVEETHAFCHWICLVVSKAPLETLKMVCESECFLWFNHDPLVEHLCVKHSKTLRSLHMHDSFISKDALRALCRSCTALEELSVSIRREALNDFPSIAAPLVRLHTVVFTIRHIKRRMDISQEFAERIFRSAPSLRRVTVDEKRFEVRRVRCLR